MAWISVDKLESPRRGGNEVLLGPIGGEYAKQIEFGALAIRNFGLEDYQSATLLVEGRNGEPATSGETILIGIQFHHKGDKGNRKLSRWKSRPQSEARISCKKLGKDLGLLPGRYALRRSQGDPEGFYRLQVRIRKQEE